MAWLLKNAETITACALFFSTLIIVGVARRK
jgi:hypothetical protein